MTVDELMTHLAKFHQDDIVTLDTGEAGGLVTLTFVAFDGDRNVVVLESGVWYTPPIEEKEK